MRKRHVEGTLRVWHIPQVPGKPFHVVVNTPKHGKQILDVLADYDLFQLENMIKPDYSNAGGLEIFENGKWHEWYDESGFNIDECQWSEDET